MAASKKKKKGRSPVQEAAMAFWACVLHLLGESDNEAKELSGFSLPLKFHSAAEYFASISRLVLAEARSTARQAWWRCQTRPSGVQLGVRSAARLPKLAKQRGVEGGLWSVSALLRRPPRDWPTLRTAWLVELRPAPGLPPAPFLVERASDGERRLQLVGFAPKAWGWGEPAAGEELPCAAPEAAQLRPLEDLVTILRMWVACCRAPGPPFMRQVMGLPEPTRLVFSDSEESDDPRAAETPAAARSPAQAAADAAAAAERALLQALNPLQREAVGRVLAAGGLENRCHLLQGPPGTGKTRTVVALLQLLSQRSRPEDARGRILLCGPSNGAVQVALAGFLGTEEGAGARVCFAGVEDRVPEAGPLRAAFLHTRAQHALEEAQRAAGDAAALPRAAEVLEGLRRCAPGAFARLRLGLQEGRPLTSGQLQALLADAGSTRGEAASSSSDGSDSDDSLAPGGGLLARLTELARRERLGEAPELESEQLDSAEAVFCTLSCAGRPGMQRGLQGRVDTVLVDEAAQAVEAETLIPLCLDPRQLVLIGDPMQLSATVCQSEAAKRAQFCRSMMERMMGNCKDFIMLQEQYRMHPEISRFPSGQFYGGRLVDARPGESVGARAGSGGLPPYAVVDVADGEEVVSSHGSLSNPREANALVRVAAWISARTSGSIVVITFYSGQASLIRKLLQGSSKKQAATTSRAVQVHTVDSFQGSEADVVLLSFVRANTSRRLGFLTEFRRLNVALTRAKQTLVVFANVTRLATPGQEAEDDVGALFSDATKRGRVWQGPETLLRAARPGKAVRRPACAAHEVAAAAPCDTPAGTPQRQKRPLRSTSKRRTKRRKEAAGAVEAARAAEAAAEPSEPRVARRRAGVKKRRRAGVKKAEALGPDRP